MTKPIAVAHRGAPMRARENTLDGLRMAQRLGADWIEADVKTTADGVPVLLHDETLARLWGVAAPVATLPLREVTGLRGPGGERIPTLAETVAVMAPSGTVLLIDLSDERVAHAVVTDAAVLAHPATVAFTGASGALAVVREAFEEATVLLTWESWGFPGAGLLARVRPQFLNVDGRFIDEDLIATARAKGLLVGVYTLDRPGHIRTAIGLGLDAIISNDIELLRALIDETAP